MRSMKSYLISYIYHQPSTRVEQIYIVCDTLDDVKDHVKSVKDNPYAEEDSICIWVSMPTAEQSELGVIVT